MTEKWLNKKEVFSVEDHLKIQFSESGDKFLKGDQISWDTCFVDGKFRICLEEISISIDQSTMNVHYSLPNSACV